MSSHLAVDVKAEAGKRKPLALPWEHLTFEVSFDAGPCRAFAGDAGLARNEGPPPFDAEAADLAATAVASAAVVGETSCEGVGRRAVDRVALPYANREIRDDGKHLAVRYEALQPFVHVVAAAVADEVVASCESAPSEAVEERESQPPGQGHLLYMTF